MEKMYQAVIGVEDIPTAMAFMRKTAVARQLISMIMAIDMRGTAVTIPTITIPLTIAIPVFCLLYGFPITLINSIPTGSAIPTAANLVERFSQ